MKERQMAAIRIKRTMHSTIEQLYIPQDEQDIIDVFNSIYDENFENLGEILADLDAVDKAFNKRKETKND